MVNPVALRPPGDLPVTRTAYSPAATSPATRTFKAACGMMTLSLYETALRHRLPVIVHTGAGAPFALPSLYILPARRFPDLPIVLGHAGGGLYSLETIVAATVCPNIFIELSSVMPHHIAEIMAHVPASRLMAGSDLPVSVETEIGKILTMEMADSDRREILWDTPAALFGG